MIRREVLRLLGLGALGGTGSLAAAKACPPTRPIEEPAQNPEAHGHHTGPSYMANVLMDMSPPGQTIARVVVVGRALGNHHAPCLEVARFVTHDVGGIRHALGARQKWNARPWPERRARFMRSWMPKA